MYGLKVYITPEDIIDRLSDGDKRKFNQCVFTDVTRESDGSITIECVVFNDTDPYVKSLHRQKCLCDDMFPNGYDLYVQHPLKLNFKGDNLDD